jgi:hypothetical protein
VANAGADTRTAAELSPLYEFRSADRRERTDAPSMGRSNSSRAKQEVLCCFIAGDRGPHTGQHRYRGRNAGVDRDLPNSCGELVGCKSVAQRTSGVCFDRTGASAYESAKAIGLISEYPPSRSRVVVGTFGETRPAAIDAPMHHAEQQQGAGHQCW